MSTEPNSPRAQQLRFSLFSTAPLVAPQNWWEAFTGQPPDVTEDRKREALVRHAGLYREGSLTINVVPNRIDVHYQPNFSVGEAPTMDPTIGEFELELRAFAADAIQWLRKIDVPAQRYALGGISCVPVESTLEGYEYLSEHLRSLTVRPGEMRDIMYRVNWPVNRPNLGVGLINRLTTFTVPIFTFHQMTPSGVPSTLVERHFVFMEFDHNTEAERLNAIDPGLTESVMSALVELALENAQEGECF